MNRGRGRGAMGNMGARAGQMAGQVSQYWKRHRADNPVLRLFVYFLAGLALLFQTLVILGCVPPSAGNDSSVSKFYLLEFNVANKFNTTLYQQLRVGYTAMCAQINGGPEHCAITESKSQESVINYLNYGNQPAPTTYDYNNTLSIPLFQAAQNLQNNVFIVLPAIPGAFLAVGVLLVFLYGTINRPWVGPASSWRQSRRNRRLDILRVGIFGFLGLSIVFSFAVAVANSQLFVAVAEVTNQNNNLKLTGDDWENIWTINEGSGALALHWLSFLTTTLFFIGVTQTTVEISAVKIMVTPGDTAGSTGAHNYAATGDQIEKAHLLRHSEPISGAGGGLAPETPTGSFGGPAGMRGRGGPRGRAGPRGRGRAR